MNQVTPIAGHDLYLERAWVIDWPTVQRRRPLLLDHQPDLPPYLLLPEIAMLLDHALHDEHRLMIDTLWHTGARVSEMLALTPKHFVFTEDDVCLVSLETLKAKRRGRPRASKRERPTKRLVPVTDARYVRFVKRYLATHAPKCHARLFPFTRQTANNRLKRLCQPLSMPFKPSIHTLRHSFAVNCVLHGVPLKSLQMWMGHASAKTTEIYTKVLGTETVHFMRAVRYDLPEAGTVAARITKG